LLFGVDLAISGMVLPDKVIGFLDIAGDWDPAMLVGIVAEHAFERRITTGRKN
jgi:hypothetical protein